MKFRPCIDLYDGKVVQIVGATLSGRKGKEPVTNFESIKSPRDYAEIYRQDNLTGGHVIALGPGNQEAMIDAVSAYPGGLQAGGSITPDNAHVYLDAGASHVIVTSYVFSGGRIDMARLNLLKKRVGKERLVLDLSCRKRGNEFWIVTERWQNFTDVAVNTETLLQLSEFCDEFLVHGVDVEGKMQGVQTELVEILGRHSVIPVTYAGGVSSMADIDIVNKLGQGRVDFTIGSALDIFGGTVPYTAVVKKMG